MAKYTRIEYFSPTKHSGAKVLDGLEIIDGWFDDDQNCPRKQRHTSRRVFDRLPAEYDYTGSYPLVRCYIKAWRQAHRLPGDGYVEPTWHPGTAQVDFGHADAVIDGERLNLYILDVTFPYSNMRFIQAYLFRTGILKHRGDKREALE